VTLRRQHCGPPCVGGIVVFGQVTLTPFLISVVRRTAAVGLADPTPFPSAR
jgi:hypothetical protein